MPNTDKMLLIFIDETDMWDDSKLYEQIVVALERQGVAGATVMVGIMGYGVHRRVHRKGLFGVSDERPITIAVVDDERKLREALRTVRPMIRQGLILLTDVEVVPLVDNPGRRSQ
jgi:PII-like signaling protein